MRTTFSNEDLIGLRKHPCVFSCTSKSVNYTYEFKRHVLEEYEKGVRPKDGIIPIFRGMKSDFRSLVKLQKCDLIDTMSTKKQNIARSAGFRQWLKEEFRMEYKHTGVSSVMEDLEVNGEKIMRTCGMHMSSTSKPLESYENKLDTTRKRYSNIQTSIQYLKKFTHQDRFIWSSMPHILVQEVITLHGV